ncbi:hypothetical protein F2P81_016778 [Scophthalmus maximus]|uniref:Uncharacterized protein n=1 Tax=Scophthalmus maximus TaxID=52904 RepID=A0A6A4SA38_SCOMX|nr:hypothetical protein F2P81_016778 [Scophthalmus maximus]
MILCGCGLFSRNPCFEQVQPSVRRADAVEKFTGLQGPTAPRPLRSLSSSSVLSSVCTRFPLFIIMLKTKQLQRNRLPFYLPSVAPQGEVKLTASIWSVRLQREVYNLAAATVQGQTSSCRAEPRATYNSHDNIQIEDGETEAPFSEKCYGK